MRPVQPPYVDNQLHQLVPDEGGHSLVVTQQETVQCAPDLHLVFAGQAHPLPVYQVLKPTKSDTVNLVYQNHDWHAHALFFIYVLANI